MQMPLVLGKKLQRKSMKMRVRLCDSDDDYEDWDDEIYED
jgi:hypothetical protein